MKVCVYSARSYDQPALQEAALGKHELTFTQNKLSIETAALAVGNQAVALFTSDDASAPVLKKLRESGVQYIVLRSIGFDHVDLREASNLKIKVANVPDYSPYSVAEHAVTLLLAANRKIVEGQRLMALQDFRIDSLMGDDIHGKTVGVIGIGKIGMAFAKAMLGFGTTVLACDPQENEEAKKLGIQYVSMSDLLAKSDIISLHCPLNDQTRHLISKSQFDQMKPRCILINTSRGPVVNTDDLVVALESGKLGAACLDVYEYEKGLFFNDHRNDTIDSRFIKLRSFKNVLITGHQAFLTHQAIRDIAAMAIANLDDWQAGKPCANELTI